MKIDVTYPAAKRSFQRHRLLNLLRWPMLAAAAACVIVNLAVGGLPWSAIVLAGLYMLWTLVLSPSLVEYNRISQTIKIISFACIMLVLIDVLITPGWVLGVMPIVCFGGLAAAGVLFFTDFERQKQNLLPLLLFILASLAGAAAGAPLCAQGERWAYIVLGAEAAGLLLVCIIAMGRDFPRELKKRFHTK